MMGLRYPSKLFKPEFLRDLLAVLGKPHTIKVSVSGKGIPKEAIKVEELGGIKLEDRYTGGAPVRLEGEASVEKMLEFTMK